MPHGIGHPKNIMTMNYKYKFKAQKLDGTWVTGSLVGDNLMAIVDEKDNSLTLCDIIPHTAGQSVGLIDRNGLLIYDGDIVQWDNFGKPRFAVVRRCPDICFDCLPIAGFKGKENTSDRLFHYWNFAYKKTHIYLEIVGNVADTKEILWRDVSQYENRNFEENGYEIFNVEKYLEEDDCWIGCAVFPTWENANAWMENEQRNLPQNKYRISQCQKN